LKARNTKLVDACLPLAGTRCFTSHFGSVRRFGIMVLSGLDTRWREAVWLTARAIISW